MVQISDLAFKENQKKEIIKLLLLREKMDSVDRLVENGWPRPSSDSYDTHTKEEERDRIVSLLRDMSPYELDSDESDKESDSDAEYETEERQLKATLIEEKKKEGFLDFMDDVIHRINCEVRREWMNKQKKAIKEGFGNLDPDTSLINKLKWLEKKFGPFNKETRAYRQMLGWKSIKSPNMVKNRRTIMITPD